MVASRQCLTTPALCVARDVAGTDQRVWEVDPLICPRCGTEMVKIAVDFDGSAKRKRADENVAGSVSA